MDAGLFGLSCSGMVGYNVQAAVDTKHHLIVAHEVTNVGTDRSQLSTMAEKTKAALENCTYIWGQY